MAISFYVDVHIPAVITDSLRQRGIRVLTSQEDGTRESGDEELLARATTLGMVLVSQDVDLLRISNDWQRQHRGFCGLVFVTQRGGSIGQTIADLALIGACCQEGELVSQVVFVPLAQCSRAGRSVCGPQRESVAGCVTVANRQH